MGLPGIGKVLSKLKRVSKKFLTLDSAWVPGSIEDG
jgi:hypothetical protein